MEKTMNEKTGGVDERLEDVFTDAETVFSASTRS